MREKRSKKKNFGIRFTKPITFSGISEVLTDQLKKTRREYRKQFLAKQVNKSMSQSHDEYIKELAKTRKKSLERQQQVGDINQLTERTADNLRELNEVMEEDDFGKSEKVRLAKKAAYHLYDLIAKFEEKLDDGFVEEIEELISDINKL